MLQRSGVWLSLVPDAADVVASIECGAAKPALGLVPTESLCWVWKRLPGQHAILIRGLTGSFLPQCGPGLDATHDSPKVLYTNQCMPGGLDRS